MNVDWEDIGRDLAGNLLIADTVLWRRDLTVYVVPGSPRGRCRPGRSASCISTIRPDQLPPEKMNFDCEAIFWADGAAPADQTPQRYRYPALPSGSRAGMDSTR